MGIEIAGIRKRYKKKEVLRGISLKAGEGSCVGILGGNGCGKSTLFSILAGVQRGDEGAFFYQGKDLLRDSGAASRALGYVPQGNPLMEELTGWDNLRLWYSRKDLERELSEGVLSMLGIDEFVKIRVSRMSGGMKKRLSIGCAMAGKPAILLLDEPSAALDLVCKERIYRYLAEYKAQGGILLLATHDVQEMELCDICYILKEGTLTPYRYDGDLHCLAGRL